MFWLRFVILGYIIHIRKIITSEYIEGTCVTFYLDTHKLNLGIYNFCGTNTKCSENIQNFET